MKPSTECLSAIRHPPGLILPVTRAAAIRWGKLDSMRRMAGRPLSAPDGRIAETALDRGLTVVTRKVKHTCAGFALERSLPCATLPDCRRGRAFVWLRDRAFVGLMVYAFARVSAVVGLKVEDYFPLKER